MANEGPGTVWILPVILHQSGQRSGPIYLIKLRCLFISEEESWPTISEQAGTEEHAERDGHSKFEWNLSVISEEAK